MQVGHGNAVHTSSLTLSDNIRDAGVGHGDPMHDVGFRMVSQYILHHLL